MEARNAKPERNEQLWIDRMRGATYRELGDRYGVVAQRARQICVAHARRIRQMLRKQGIDWERDY